MGTPLKGATCDGGRGNGMLHSRRGASVKGAFEVLVDKMEG